MTDPNAAEGADTGRLGDRSPKPRRVSEKKVLEALLNTAAPSARPNHALDDAATNSKIIVVNKTEGPGRVAVLATPDGPQLLPVGDPAHLLPIGTKIYKSEQGFFDARLPDEYADHAPAVGDFARAADLIAHLNTRIAGTPV